MGLGLRPRFGRGDEFAQVINGQNTTKVIGHERVFHGTKKHNVLVARVDHLAGEDAEKVVDDLRLSGT